MNTKVQERIRVGRWKGERGVYARRLLRRNMVIGEMTGEVIDDPDYFSDYGVDMGGSCTLEIEPPWKYLNHCCKPNCAIVYDDDDVDENDVAHKLYLQVVDTVRPDEQLTIDYAWSADGAIQCRCGSEQCRGWVVDKNELHLVEEPEPEPKPRKRKPRRKKGR